MAIFQKSSVHALPGQRFTHQIVVSDRCAAKRDEHVRSRIERRCNARRYKPPVVRDDAEIEDAGARRPGNRGHAEAVRSDDLVRSGMAARRQQLVAGGDDGDERPCARLDKSVIRGGGERERGRVEVTAGGQERIAFREVETGAADVALGWQRFPAPRSLRRPAPARLPATGWRRRRPAPARR